MPSRPTERQKQASRVNGAKSSGPRDTSVSRFNALTHGFTAALKPPTEPEQRRLFEEIIRALCEEYLPCSPSEWMALEQIAVLELRRCRIQEAIMAECDISKEEDLRRIALLSRYETETFNKLERAWRRLHELQASRQQRRGLALEAALIRPHLESARAQMRDNAYALAERALSRELADLAVPPEVAQRVARTLVGSGSFRNTAPPADAQPAESESESPDAPLPPTIPGPPWSPWFGVPDSQLQAWNHELVERRRARLRAELEELEAASGPSPD